MSTNGKMVDIERTTAKFLAFFDEAIDLLNFQVAKIKELSATDAVIKREMEKFQLRVAIINELT